MWFLFFALYIIKFPQLHQCECYCCEILNKKFYGVIFCFHGKRFVFFELIHFLLLTIAVKCDTIIMKENNMGKYSFNFSVDKSGTCKISLSKSGIVFSKEAIEALGKPQKVHIGIDKTKKVLGVCVAQGNTSIKAFDFATTEARTKWLRIQSKPLVREIELITKNQFGGTGASFPAHIEEDDGVKYLIVELNKK